MTMDITFFYFGSFIILFMALFGMVFQKERGVLLAFIGGLFGIVFTVSVNSQATFTGLATGASTALWPALYLPIFFTLLSFSTALYEGYRR